MCYQGFMHGFPEGFFFCVFHVMDHIPDFTRRTQGQGIEGGGAEEDKNREGKINVIIHPCGP